MQTTIFTSGSFSLLWVAPLRHAGSLKELAGDDEALDLLRALVELRDLRVAHHALDRVLGDIAVSAQHLDRVGGDPHGGVTGHELGAAGPVWKVRRIRIDARGRGVGELTRGLGLRGHVGEHPLDPLEVRYPLAELLPI